MATPEAARTIDEQLIGEIVRRVLSVAKPDRIILFGSAAQATMTRDSDIDLLILERELGDENAEYVRIRRALRGMGYPFDVILITTDWFEASKNVIGGIAYPANRHGRVIYDAA